MTHFYAVAPSPAWLRPESGSQNGLQRNANIRRIGMAQHDLRRLVPAGAGGQGGREFRQQGLSDGRRRFEMKRFHLEKTFTPVRFGVQASDQIPPVQNGKAEVAVAALRGGGIGLDPIVEPEKLPRTRAVGDDGVEG